LARLAQWTALLMDPHVIVLRGVALVVALPLFVGGCASVSPTTPTTVRISVQQAQAEFGTMGVATVERAPQVSSARHLFPLLVEKGPAWAP
jgi:hypothetical protein